MKAGRIQEQDSVTESRVTLKKSCYGTSMLIERRICQGRISRDAVLEEVVGGTLGLMDCTPTGELDEARHLIELVGEAPIHATPLLGTSSSPMGCSVSPVTA
jgi:hypothetical protein